MPWSGTRTWPGCCRGASWSSGAGDTGPAAAGKMVPVTGVYLEAGTKRRSPAPWTGRAGAGPQAGTIERTDGHGLQRVGRRGAGVLRRPGGRQLQDVLDQAESRLRGAGAAPDDGAA